MGWSCTADASRVMEAWTAACIAQTGSQNEYRVNDLAYFWETGPEHDDGAITGRIFRMAPEGCYPAGAFRIEPNGTITRAPAFLKHATKGGRS